MIENVITFKGDITILNEFLNIRLFYNKSFIKAIPNDDWFMKVQLYVKNKHKIHTIKQETDKT